VRVWIPVPQTDQHQTVRVLAVKAPVKTRMTQEPGIDLTNEAVGRARLPDIRKE
jgi:hypothetical protein